MFESATLDKSALEDIAAQIPELVAIRRDIHAHPELGLEEHRTAALVAEKLKAWGIETTVGVGGTGVVGTIKGSGPGVDVVACALVAWAAIALIRSVCRSHSTAPFGQWQFGVRAQ